MARPDWLGAIVSEDDWQALQAAAEAYDLSPRAQARERAKAAEERNREIELDESMTEKALAGSYGNHSRDLADEHIRKNGRDAASLRSLRRLLAKVEGRTPA